MKRSVGVQERILQSKVFENFRKRKAQREGEERKGNGFKRAKEIRVWEKVMFWNVLFFLEVLELFMHCVDFFNMEVYRLLKVDGLTSIFQIF